MTVIKQRLRNPMDLLAGYINIIPSSVVTQALAAAGADVLMIDQEHRPIGPENLHAMIASTAGTPCSPWVRVPRRDEVFVKTALDAGAEGIVFPLVTTADSAAECVALTRYPPSRKTRMGAVLRAFTMECRTLRLSASAGRCDCLCAAHRDARGHRQHPRYLQSRRHRPYDHRSLRSVY